MGLGIRLGLEEKLIDDGDVSEQREGAPAPSPEAFKLNRKSEEVIVVQNRCHVWASVTSDSLGNRTH